MGAIATEMETQGNRAPLKSFVLCSFQVADHTFVVSVQVCQFALAYHRLVTKKMCLQKKIRACSWSLGLYHEHESAVPNGIAGKETGPGACRACRETRLPGPLCIHPWRPPKRGWETPVQRIPIPMDLLFPDSFAKYWLTVRAKKKSIWQNLGMNLCTWKKKKLRHKKVQINLPWFALDILYHLVFDSNNSSMADLCHAR